MRPRLLDLFESSAARVNNGCWSWSGSHNPQGYGRFWLSGVQHYAHRVSYELFVGQIPDGLEIDHLCQNTGCCNPAHLEPVTHAENQRRIRDRQTSCRRAGHDWSNPKNVYTRKNGRRWCAACSRGDQKERRSAHV